MDETLTIGVYDDARHRDRVMALWQAVFGYEDAHNEPGRVIDMKRAHPDDLFFVARRNGDVVGTAMAGYDGHRGWIYSVAVDPHCRKQGIGSALLARAQKDLTALGCLKVNLQILAGNEAVKAFYAANGFLEEARISMGKRL